MALFGSEYRFAVNEDFALNVFPIGPVLQKRFEVVLNLFLPLSRIIGILSATICIWTFKVSKYPKGMQWPKCVSLKANHSQQIVAKRVRLTCFPKIMLSNDIDTAVDFHPRQKQFIWVIRMFQLTQYEFSIPSPTFHMCLTLLRLSFAELCRMFAKFKDTIRFKLLRIPYLDINRANHCLRDTMNKKCIMRESECSSDTSF